MDREQLIKIGKGALIAAAGAVLAYIAESVIPMMEESSDGVLLTVAAILSVLVNALRKMLSGQSLKPSDTPKTLLVLALVLACSGSAMGQTARYNGRDYTPQNFPRAITCQCKGGMCKAIRTQWRAQGWSHPLDPDPKPATNQWAFQPTLQNLPRVVSQPVQFVQVTQQASRTVERPALFRSETRYQTVTRYRTETYQQKHCNGVTCYWTTETRQVPYQAQEAYTVQVPIAEPVVEPAQPSTEVAADAYTPHAVVAEMVRLLELDSSSVFCDVGSGDGRIVRAAIPTGARCFGIEIDRELANRTHRELYPQATIYFGDALKTDRVAEATHVAVYLYPDQIAELVARLSPGTRIVSYAHEIPGLPNERHAVGGESIFTATKPERVSVSQSVLIPTFGLFHNVAAPSTFGL